MKEYKGVRDGYKIRVTVNGYELNSKQDLVNHSPEGFEWGYLGSGPAQLSLALLADCFDNDLEALRYYQKFKNGVIGKLDRQLEHWSMDEDFINKWHEEVKSMEDEDEYRK